MAPSSVIATANASAGGISPLELYSAALGTGFEKQYQKWQDNGMAPPKGEELSELAELYAKLQVDDSPWEAHTRIGEISVKSSTGRFRGRVEGHDAGRQVHRVFRPVERRVVGESACRWTLAENRGRKNQDRG